MKAFPNMGGSPEMGESPVSKPVSEHAIGVSDTGLRLQGWNIP